MIIAIAIIISIAIMAVMTIIIRKYFKLVRVREKIRNGESFLLNKERGNIRLAIGATIYLIAMVAFAEVKYYELLNILLATILIDLVAEINKAIKAIDSE